MIHVDETTGKVHIEGTYPTIMAEVTQVLVALVDNDKANITPEDVIEDITLAFQFKKLISAGMTTQEAAKILGLTERETNEQNIKGS